MNTDKRIRELELQVQALTNRDTEWKKHHEENRIYLAKIERELLLEKDKSSQLLMELEKLKSKPKEEQPATSESLLENDFHSLDKRVKHDNYVNNLEVKSKEIEELKSKVDTLTNEIKQLRFEKKTLEAVVATQHLQIDQLPTPESIRRIHNYSINGPSDREIELEKTCTNLQDLLARRDDEINQVESEINLYKQEIFMLQQNSTKNTQMIENLIAENSALIESLNSMKRQQKRNSNKIISVDTMEEKFVDKAEDNVQIAIISDNNVNPPRSQNLDKMENGISDQPVSDSSPGWFGWIYAFWK